MFKIAKSHPPWNVWLHLAPVSPTILQSVPCSAMNIILAGYLLRESISKAVQSRGEPSINLHNLFLINVGPVIIVAVTCQLIGCRYRGNPMFRCVAVLFTIYTYTAMAAPLRPLVQHDNQLKTRFCVRFWGFCL